MLLQEWYVKDTNAKPSEYVLQEITKDLNLKADDVDNESSDLDKIAEARKTWQDVDEKLKECLRKCVTLCLEDGSIGQEQAEKYFWSGMIFPKLIWYM